MAIVGFDYGHGGRDPGATYKGRKEADDVLKVGMKTAKIMRNHGVEVDETRSTDKTLSLRQRSNFLNRKKYYFVVSFHRNAFNSKAKGVEVYAHPQSNIKSKKLSKRMNDELVKIGFTNRGAKTANFHMLREINAYSVLPEIGFIDNPADNKLFDDNIDNIAEGIAKSLLIEMGISYKESSGSSKPTSKPSAPAKNKPTSNNLAIDGHWGPATTRALQRYFKTKVDGVISGQYPNGVTRQIPSASFSTRTGSDVIIALQRKIGATPDRYIGVGTVRALQRYLGTPIDGHISRPSLMVKELQRKLNNGTF